MNEPFTVPPDDYRRELFLVVDGAASFNVLLKLTGKGDVLSREPFHRVINSYHVALLFEIMKIRDTNPMFRSAWLGC